MRLIKLTTNTGIFAEKPCITGGYAAINSVILTGTIVWNPKILQGIGDPEV
jgi:hypothetical protein